MANLRPVLLSLLSGASAVGRNLLAAADKSSARSAIDAETVGAAAAAQTAAASDATTKASAAQAAAISAAASDATTKAAAAQAVAISAAATDATTKASAAQAAAIAAAAADATAKADAAQAAAIAAAPAAPTPLFEAGNGWTIVASAVSGTAATTYAVGADGLPGVARFTMTTSGNPTAAALNGPRIERAVTWNAARRWRIRVSFVGVSTTLPSFGGNIAVWLYLRDGSGNVFTKRVVIYYWNDTAGGPVAYPAWTGGTKEFRLDRSATILEGMVSAAGVWTQTSSSTLTFTPTHVGLAGEASGSGAGYIDVRDLVIESFV